MSHRQFAFAQECPLDHNGTAALLRAGYVQSGAHVEDLRLLRNPNPSLTPTYPKSRFFDLKNYVTD